MKGDLAREIRRVAAHGKPFTHEAIQGDYTMGNKVGMLRGLWLRGELVRVKKGKMGCKGDAAVYQGKVA